MKINWKSILRNEKVTAMTDEDFRKIMDLFQLIDESNAEEIINWFISVTENKTLSNAERQKRYRERNANRNETVTETVTKKEKEKEKETEERNEKEKSNKKEKEKKEEKEIEKEKEINWQRAFGPEANRAEAFAGYSGIKPLNSEYGRWQKDLRSFTEAGISIELMCEAIQKVRKEGKYPIKAPGSVLTEARNLMVSQTKSVMDYLSDVEWEGMDE